MKHLLPNLSLEISLSVIKHDIYLIIHCYLIKKQRKPSLLHIEILSLICLYSSVMHLTPVSLRTDNNVF